MRVEQFEMERMQSTFENQVAYNLSESGVTPLSLGELVAEPTVSDALTRERLRYTQSNGTTRLRELIASQYPGATADHIQVTNGGAEANYITTWNLVEPGDEVVYMVPSYMQTWGLVRAFGGSVKEWPLIRPSGSDPWRMDVDALDRLVNARTKLIVICNPNNPTGARFDHQDLDHVAAAAERHGCWILSDEVYRGAERDGRETPSMWGRSGRVMVTSGLSKAYGLPGLRIGWIAGPARLVCVALVVSRLHDDFSRGAQRLPRVSRVEPGPARRHPGQDSPDSQRRISRSSIDGCATTAASSVSRRPTPARSSTCAITIAVNSTLLVNQSAREEKRADRARRSLRDGRIPSHRLRRRDRLPARGADATPRPARRHRRRGGVTFDLVLVGFGNVGRRFVRLLDESRARLLRRPRRRRPVSSASRRGRTATSFRCARTECASTRDHGRNGRSPRD